MKASYGFCQVSVIRDLAKIIIGVWIMTKSERKDLDKALN